MELKSSGGGGGAYSNLLLSERKWAVPDEIIQDLYAHTRRRQVGHDTRDTKRQDKRQVIDSKTTTRQ